MNIRRQVFLILSSGTTYQVFGGIAPSTAVSPYIVFSIISDVPGYTHAGFDDTSVTRVQASAFSTVSYASAANMAEKIVTVLNATPGTYGVAVAHKENEFDLYEEASKSHHIPVDFMIGRVTYSTST